MAGSTLPAWFQALGAVVTVIAIILGAGHRYLIKPAHETAEDAMSKARAAHQQAEDNREDIDDLDGDLRETLDHLSQSIDHLADSLEEQRRESRGQSYQIYTLAKAINESDDLPDVPVPNEDQFLRGGESEYSD